MEKNPEGDGKKSIPPMEKNPEGGGKKVGDKYNNLSNTTLSDTINTLSGERCEWVLHHPSERHTKNLNGIQKSYIPVQKTDMGCSKNLNGGIQKTGTHNILDNLNDNIDDNNTLSGESIVWECVTRQHNPFKSPYS